MRDGRPISGSIPSATTFSRADHTLGRARYVPDQEQFMQLQTYSNNTRPPEK